MTNQTPSFSFRLPLNIRERLEQIAVDKDVSIAHVIIEILKRHLGM